ncbi:ArsR/SmtB family transcription factor [Saccharicrinis aurantiacus]|uniref:ArsR/SmtB family transcription factor n=1 Tax=Saccharicrinis aurantiacus TaxID=1849719 RepID=UPI0009502A9F|nr:metalloregulator ArsR/SmtB family transcription factor [Saccharicrinis aurantiacus]
MVQKKSELFSEELTEQASYFKALSHPARIQILNYLATINTCITGDISEQLPLGRTTVNQHIKELKNIGLIKGNIEGVKTKYCLNTEKVKELKQIMSAFLSEVDNSEYKC